MEVSIKDFINCIKGLTDLPIGFFNVTLHNLHKFYINKDTCVSISCAVS